MRILLVILISFLTGLVTGCTALKRPPPPVEIQEDELAYDPASHESVEGQLLASAKSIEKSLLTLAETQEYENPPILSTGPLVTPEGGMGGTVNIDWTGPIEPLLDRIAKMADYRLKILGNEPAIPIVITITGKRSVLADVLQNASFQAAKRAHVLVFPNTRVIELRYLS
jgi:defect in organelle trafficking protein DotD